MNMKMKMMSSLSGFFFCRGCRSQRFEVRAGDDLEFDGHGLTVLLEVVPVAVAVVGKRISSNLETNKGPKEILSACCYSEALKTLKRMMIVFKTWERISQGRPRTRTKPKHRKRKTG